MELELSLTDLTDHFAVPSGNGWVLFDLIFCFGSVFGALGEHVGADHSFQPAFYCVQMADELGPCFCILFLAVVRLRVGCTLSVFFCWQDLRVCVGCMSQAWTAIVLRW